MGYLHICNLYKYKHIFLFKECYALEKIHGTSTHIGWKCEKKVLHFFSGGENHEKFLNLFDKDFLTQKFEEIFPNQDVIIFGEAYGGKQQGMSHTYGKELKFIGFDVKIDDNWLNVPSANRVCDNFNIEFVAWSKTEVDIEKLTVLRDSPSIQAERNGCGNNKKREGIVIRPLIEMKINNNERVICKYKSDEAMETKTKRDITEEQLQILTEANEIAEEWVTSMRLEHILQKFPQELEMKFIPDIISAMIEDVYREGKDELVESRETTKAIGTKTVKLFKQKLQNILRNDN